MSKQMIIALSREFGSGGADIARALADRFELPLYEKNTLEHIAREDEAAAALIRERMDALQDEICTSGVIGDPAAEICWHAALDLLTGFKDKTGNRTARSRLSGI